MQRVYLTREDLASVKAQAAHTTSDRLNGDFVGLGAPADVRKGARAGVAFTNEDVARNSAPRYAFRCADPTIQGIPQAFMARVHSGRPAVPFSGLTHWTTAGRERFRVFRIIASALVGVA